MNKEQIVIQLWCRLWQNYRQRVKYARIYEQMIEDAGGIVANDHIAFRSLQLNVPSPEGTVNLGIPYLAKIATALGYEVAGDYRFPGQHLYARHYCHPAQDRCHLPKLFISELIVEELPNPIIAQIVQTVRHAQCFTLGNLKSAIETASTPAAMDQIAQRLQTAFVRPWPPPRRSVVEAVNTVSQYGAWVLLHGYTTNHFTGYINQQPTSQYPDIESTVLALTDRGVPMKDTIEGSRGSGLRQTATQAVTEWVTVQDDDSDQSIQIPWPYAYYELAERNWVEVSPGQQEWFDGFLDAQARHLFEMTRKKEQSGFDQNTVDAARLLG